MDLSIDLLLIFLQADCHMIHHTYLLIPATLVCSFSFTTAVGTGSNALIVAFSNIRGYDLAMTGLAPAMVSFVVVWLTFPLYGSFFFPDIKAPYLRPSVYCQNTTLFPNVSYFVNQ